MEGHFGTISQIQFPQNYGQVFASCSFDEIRIWGQGGKELLKIELVQGNQIEYAKCNCIEFVPDGKSVISGWTDGRIRAFLPQSGKLFWVINDAHKAINKDFGGVMCLTAAQNCEHILTGG